MWILLVLFAFDIEFLVLQNNFIRGFASYHKIATVKVNSSNKNDWMLPVPWNYTWFQSSRKSWFISDSLFSYLIFVCLSQSVAKISSEFRIELNGYEKKLKEEWEPMLHINRRHSIKNNIFINTQENVHTACEWIDWQHQKHVLTLTSSLC